MGSYSIEFKKETLDAVCNKLVEGVSLRSILRQEGMPPIGTFMRWINEDEHFAEQYAQAKMIGIEVLAEEILEIADESTSDKLYTREVYDAETGEKKYLTVENKEFVNRSRLRVDTRKWLLSKMIPKKYGDNLEFYEQKRLEKEKEQNGDSNITVERIKTQKN